MPIHSSIPEVTMHEAEQAVICAAAADTPVLLLGDPGVGKSALAKIVAAKLNLRLVTLLGSTLDPTDVGGLPVKMGNTIERIPLKMVQLACDEPVLFFLDEISCAPPAVQATLLRLILERVAGDAQLHEGTRIIAAANPPEQAPGGFELSAPLMGRLCVLKLRPTDAEVVEFFKNLDAPAKGEDPSTLHLESVDFALTCGFVPEILQIDIPSGCVAGNIPWGAPRAWERAIRARACAADRGAGAGIMHTLTAGNVGDEAGTAYEAILKLRTKLPSVEQVLEDPAKCLVPEDRQHQIAAVGLVPRVAKVNTWAAWIYANRLIPEIGAACSNILMKTLDSPVSSAFAREGVKARVKLSSITKGG